MKKLVDIGLKKLEIDIQSSGAPIIIIETGMECSWYDWCKVISEISKKAAVLTYHRAGYGESTPGREERSTRQIAEDLNRLLETENISSPVILVGHSFGGLCVQNFANLFPEKVQGMVLIDSNSVDEYKMDELRNKLTSFREKFPKGKIIENWRELSLKSKSQLQKLISPKLLPEQMGFSEDVQKCIMDFQINPNMYSAMASELEFMSQSGQEIKDCQKKLDIPLKVLARDKALGIKWNIDMGIPGNDAVELENLWHELVMDEAEISTKGEFLEVKGSRHSIYRTNPEIIIDTINDVIDEIG